MAKNAAREMLMAKLRSLALAVQQACGDDLAVLLPSGYEATRSPTPAGVLPAPRQVTLTQGALQWHARSARSPGDECGCV